MFKDILKISLKLGSTCPVQCDYCFQKDAPNNKGDFVQWDNLQNFVSSLPIKNNYLNLRLIGGEVSTMPKEIIRSKDVIARGAKGKKIVCGLTTNAFAYQNLLDLCYSSVLDPSYINISWDGLYGDKLIRFPKSKVEFSNNSVEKLVSVYGSSIGVIHALTVPTLPFLADSFMEAHKWGARKFGVYNIKEYDYTSEDILLYEKELHKIADKFFTYLGTAKQFRFHNFMLLNNLKDIAVNKDNMNRLTNCFNLGRIIHVHTDGKLYPCIFMGDYDMFCLGDLENGLDKSKVNLFIDALYAGNPVCTSNCKNLHCFECPAANFLEKGNLYNRKMNTCNIASLEKEVFSLYSSFYPEKMKYIMKENDPLEQYSILGREVY